METISIRRDVWENMQSALAKLVHYVTVPFETPLDVLTRAEVASELSPSERAQVDVDSAQLELDKARQRAADLAAEDATFEGRTEFSGLFSDSVTAGFNALSDAPIPYMLTPRVFERGDIIPDDVKRLRVSNEEKKSFQVVERKDVGRFGYLHVASGGWGTSDTTDPCWGDEDFPLTEVFEDVTYSVFEAVDHLKHHGIDTDAIRLHRFLNTGAAWTDGFGFPRECVSEYLIAGDSMASVSPVPVELRFTPVGLAELVRIMKVAV